MRLFQLDLFSYFPKLRPVRRRNPTYRRRTVIVRQDQRLREIWDQLHREFFPEHQHLATYTIAWSSRRQKRVLATCFPTKLIVKVAAELYDDSYHEWLAPLLYHEMCHAVLGIQRTPCGRKHIWHGAEFRALERRHPKISALDAWIKSGGWSQAVRRDRGRRAAAARSQTVRQPRMNLRSLFS